MKDLPIQDQTIAYLSVEGWDNSEIAAMLKVKDEFIRLKLTDERIKEKARVIQYHLYSADHKKRFQDLLPHAIDSLEEVIKDPSVKPQIKMSAITETIDRALGKPKQTVEHEGSLVRAMLERLNQTENTAPKEVISVEYKEIPPAPNPNEEIFKKSSNPNLNDEDLVDSWIKRNLK